MHLRLRPWSALAIGAVTAATLSAHVVDQEPRVRAVAASEPQLALLRQEAHPPRRPVPSSSTTAKPTTTTAPVTTTTAPPPTTNPPAPTPDLQYDGNPAGSVNGYPCGGDLPPCWVLKRESGGNPTAENPTSTASGLWQFIDSTWAGFGGYSHASHAPPSVQNEKARQVWAGGAGCSHWSAC